MTDKAELRSMSRYLVADVADASEELQEVRLAVRQPGLLEVAAAEEGLLALGARKVIHVPAWHRIGFSVKRTHSGKDFDQFLMTFSFFSNEEVSPPSTDGSVHPSSCPAL